MGVGVEMPSASRPRTRSAGTPSFEKCDIVLERFFRKADRLREQRIPHSACARWIDEKRIVKKGAGVIQSGSGATQAKGLEQASPWHPPQERRPEFAFQNNFRAL